MSDDRGLSRWLDSEAGRPEPRAPLPGDPAANVAAEADVAGPAWAGVVPMATGYREPVDAPDLRAGIAGPDSVRRFGTPDAP